MPEPPKYTFKTSVWSENYGAGLWHYIDVHLDIKTLFGKTHAVPVCGTINGAAFQSSIMNRLEAPPNIPIRKSVLLAACSEAGDEVEVVLWLDLTSREPVLPEDLELYLVEEKLIDHYKKLQRGQKNYLIDQLDGAKKLETRINRLGKFGDLIRRWRSEKS